MCKRQSNGDTIKCKWCGITVPKPVVTARWCNQQSVFPAVI